VPKLSVTLITRNEAAHIAAALESVRWADELIVVDAESTDETVALARRYADRVEVRAWPGYGEQKNYAAALATHDWILSIDADERVSAGLAREIRTLLAAEPPCRGYRIPRVTWYLGRWIRSTDWYPDYQLRLYDRRVGRWQTRRVHESVRVEGRVGRLRHAIEHLAYRDLSHHLQTIDRYSTLAAEEWREAGRRAGFLAIALHPPLAFLRNYLWRRGFVDGTPGLVVSALNAYYVLLKLAKRWALDHAGAPPEAAARDPDA
jgi:glycosyltransferase involved in cell wall biosynthesis